MCLLFLFLIGAVVLPTNLADGHGHVRDFVFRPENVSDVAPQRKTVVVGVGLAVGKVLVSLWSSMLSDRVVEIDISNRLTTSLTDPTWYMLHGYAAILPPYYIKENEPSTKIQFYRKPNSAFGTEGATSYQIISQGILSLVFMWKVPQGPFSKMGFYIKIEKGPISAENLKRMFKNVDNNQWIAAEKLRQWQTGNEQGVTWKAAMGTRSITTLKIVIV